MLKLSRNTLVSTVAAAGLALASAVFAPANATQIITFGQTSNSNTAFFTNPTTTSTTLTIANAAIFVTQFAGPGGGGFSAFLGLLANNTGPSVLAGGLFDQHFSGTFCITSAANCGGINYLSGTFADDLGGALGGSSLTLSASTPPPGAVTFTSSILTASQLDVQRAFSLAFTNGATGNALCPIGIGVTYCANNFSFSGNASAQIGARVPEPATLALLGLGLAGLGFARRKRA